MILALPHRHTYTRPATAFLRWQVRDDATPEPTRLRQRIRERISQILDRLDERWSDENLGGRWSGICCFRNSGYLPSAGRRAESR